MLRLPSFQVHAPTTPEQAVRLRAELGARYLAGGTDLLPNLKHGLDAPEHLVSLHRVEGLDRVTPEADGALHVGASVTLHDLAAHPAVRAHLPALATAAGEIAGPQHRRMGTVGGNVLLDTRCVYYNQSASWREALGGCLKADGSWCHVLGSAKGCVAAQSADTVPVLVAADATALCLTTEGPSSMPLRELYGTDGRRDRMHALPEGALLLGVRIPPLPDGTRSTYRKVRPRAAIDFPQLGVAAIGRLEGSRLLALEIVLGALLPRPRSIDRLDVHLGHDLDDARIDAIAEQCLRQSRTVPQVAGDPDWRRHMVAVTVGRALRDLRG